MCTLPCLIGRLYLYKLCTLSLGAMVEGPLQRLSLKQVTASPSASNQDAPTATLVQAHPKKNTRAVKERLEFTLWWSGGQEPTGALVTEPMRKLEARVATDNAHQRRFPQTTPAHLADAQYKYKYKCKY